MISAATEKLEEETGLVITNKTYKYTLDRFSRSLALPVKPVLSIENVGYHDKNGDLQTLDTSDYMLVNRIDQPAIIPAYGKTWPETWDFEEGVIIEFTAGFSSSQGIPMALRQAILKTTAGLYEYRENITTSSAMTLPEGVRYLIRDHIQWRL